jgi:hypothetical protein
MLAYCELEILQSGVTHQLMAVSCQDHFCKAPLKGGVKRQGHFGTATASPRLRKPPRQFGEFSVGPQKQAFAMQVYENQPYA